MTTEVSSETEVKDKAEESAAQTDQSEKTTQETQEVANAEGDVNQKEGEEKDGKGITRYLPTWLKKQKSLVILSNSFCSVFCSNQNHSVYCLMSCFIFLPLLTDEDLSNQGGSDHRGNG